MVGFVPGLGHLGSGGNRIAANRVCDRKPGRAFALQRAGGGGARVGHSGRERDGVVLVWWRPKCGGNMEALRRARLTGCEVQCVVFGTDASGIIPPTPKVHRITTTEFPATAILRICMTTGASEVFCASSDDLLLAREERLTRDFLLRFGRLLHLVDTLQRNLPALASASTFPMVKEKLEDGTMIEYDDSDGNLKAIVHEDHRTLEEKFTDFIYGIYLPDGFPGSVTSDYFRFTQWRVLQNIASSVMAVISTEALLFGLGLGKTGSAVAAATAWVLKDGLGYMGKVLYGYLAGKQFDSDPKSWRVSSDAVEDLGGVLELLTPLFPGNFLLLASIANAMKGVAGMTGTATRHAIYKSLALRDNQGDIATKGESQGVTCKMIGLGLGIGVSTMIGQKYAVLLAAYSSFAVVHLLGNWQSMKCVQFSTINRQRGSIVMDSFMANEPIPTPYDVSHMEKIVFPPWRKFNHHVVLGASISQATPTTKILNQATDAFAKSPYLATSRNGRMYVVFRDGATAEDVLSAYLMSHRYARNGLDLNEASNYAKKNTRRFITTIRKAGWKTESSVFLLNVLKNRSVW
ncbi:hypothetical protein NDN08_000688 [Rhodosorus marinus]|uniref:DUF647 domain-containing protein n=1 Tax=Rhodosorus marinus TaxID=101924 RepID=A0AAV8UNT2_9RHOD|nr:hypothetical protein NDN08_000688 [Rhodosorus marinus]